MIKKLLILIFSWVSMNALSQKVTLSVPSGHSKAIDKVVTSNNGRYIASMADKTAILWDLASNRKLYEINFDINLFASEVNSLSITDEPDKIVACTNDGLYCYNVKEGKKIFSEGNITSGAAVNADGTTIYAINAPNFYLLDASTGKKIKTITGVTNSSASKCQFYDIGNHQVLILYYFGWSIVDTESGDVLLKKEFKDIYSLKMKQYEYKHSDHTVVAMRNDSLIVYDVKTANIVRAQLPVYDPSGFCLIPNNQLVLFATNYKAKSKVIEVLQLPSFNVIKTVTQPESEVPQSIYYGDQAAALPGTGKVFYNNDKELFLFDVASGKYESRFNNKVTDFKNYYYYPSLSQRLQPDNSLTIASNDWGLRKFDLETLKPEDYIQTMKNLIVSADGKLAVSLDAKATLINAQTGQFIKTIPLPPSVDVRITRFFFNSTNSKLIFTDGSKGNLMSIDLTTGAITKLATLGELISETSASFDGKYLAGIVSKSNINYLVVYNVNTKATVFSKRICDPYKDSDCPNDISFINDSYYLFMSGDESVHIYKADDAAYTSSFKVPHHNPFILLGGDIKNNVIAIGEVGQFQAGTYNMQLITKEGKVLKELQAVNNASFLKASFTKDNKVMFTPTTQKGVQVWNVETGELLGTYYFIENTKEYIFVTPEGLFDGSDAGMRELYFVKNGKPLVLEKMYEQYYTPNVLRRKLYGEKFAPIPVDQLHDAPEVSITYVAAQRNLTVEDDLPIYQNTTGVADITVNATTSDDAIDEIRLFHNGKIVTLVSRNLIVEDDKTKTAVKKYSIHLLPGKNSIRAVALNTQRTESNPAAISIQYQSANAPDNGKQVVVNDKSTTLDLIDKNATLYLVVVGINAYKNPKMNLNYALADATAFKDEVEKDAKTVLTNIKTYFIADNAADKTGITTAMRSVQQQAKPQDVFVFYYAGHGVIAGGNKEFYLVPSNVADLKNVDAALQEHGIAARDLQQHAIDIPAQKQLFILDACQSAGVFQQMLSADGNQQKNIALVARSTGTHWMAASGAQQFANEFATLGHGAFTYVLLQALKGEAASNKMITVEGLKNYMHTGVPALMKQYSGSQQTPASYGFGNDFPIEILK